MSASVRLSASKPADGFHLNSRSGRKRLLDGYYVEGDVSGKSSLMVFSKSFRFSSKRLWISWQTPLSQFVSMKASQSLKLLSM